MKEGENYEKQSLQYKQKQERNKEAWENSPTIAFFILSLIDRLIRLGNEAKDVYLLDEVGKDKSYMANISELARTREFAN